MSIYITYHATRKKQAETQYKYLRSFYQDEIVYICHNTTTPISDTRYIRLDGPFCKQNMWKTILDDAKGRTLILDCDRFISPNFYNLALPPKTVRYPSVIYSIEEFNDFYLDIFKSKHKEKIPAFYHEVSTKKVPTSGTTLFNAQDLTGFKEEVILEGYGYGDVATYLAMIKFGMRFLASSEASLHLKHDYDMTHDEFVNQNLHNALIVADKFHLPLSKELQNLHQSRNVAV